MARTQGDGAGAWESCKDVLAGAVRGATQVLVGQPLDTMKVRLQTLSSGPAVDATMQAGRYAGLADCARQTLRDEGVAGFYRGALSPLLFCAAYSATLFCAYGQATRLAHALQGEEQAESGLRLPYQVFAGALTGGVAALVEGPSELLKIKMQVQIASQGGQCYRNSLHCGVCMVRSHGMASLFQGTFATFVRNVPGSAVYFSCYELCKAAFDRAGVHLSSNYLLSGAASGVMFWLSIYPLDVLKSHVQAQAAPRTVLREPALLWHTARRLAQSKGTFWKGLPVVLIRAAPTNAATFLMYEWTRSWLDRLPV